MRVKSNGKIYDNIFVSKGIGRIPNLYSLSPKYFNVIMNEIVEEVIEMKGCKMDRSVVSRTTLC